MSSRKRSNSVQSEASTHSEATSPRRRVVRRTQQQNNIDSDGSDSEQENRRSRLKKKSSSQKRSSNQNQKSTSKRSNVPNHIKIGKSIFFEQPSSSITMDDNDCEYFDSRCICDQKTSEHSNKIPMSSLILLNRIDRFKKQQDFKRIQNKDDEQILLDIIEREGLYTKKEIERNRNINFEKSCDPSLTQEEKLQVIKRLKDQHELFRRLEKRDRKHQIYQLRCVIPHVSNEEALYALKLTNNIEEEAIIKLTDYTFLQQIRKEIALEYNPNPSLTVDHLVPLADKWNYEQDQNSPESPSMSDQNETPSTSTSFIPPNESSKRSVTPVTNNISNSNNNDEMSDEEEEDDKDDDDFVIKERKKPSSNKTSKTKQKETKKSSSKKSSKKSRQEESQSECEIEEEEEDEEISEIDEEIKQEEKKKRKRKTSTNISSSRLLLDDALSDVIKKDGWSKARIEAYEKINTNPNAYYYRFNEPGESQKNGKWNQKEKELFIKKLKEYIEKTDNFQWGLFSKRIPGRVGYQCSNFYRTLLKSGDFKLDIVEECKNKSGGGSASSASKSSSSSSTSKKRKKPTTPTRKSKKKKVVEPSDDEEDEDSHQNDSESVSSHTGSSSNNSKSDSESSEQSSDEDSDDENHTRNILEDFIDPITLEQVKDPAISPYGHVLGYQTWLKVLNTEPKNTCPYTKQTLTKRHLVKLNFDNIEEFKSKIRNFN
ncbi:predicted protein [Naegleria gruberi]|uniref:Predicted protein n=1 Tax=Naegleria gruberi TaxID=5762 RepID=D2V9A5_NAEGR|nr:uncharacterized protein NAEGRDRAFT_65372 [Naegleria gruberi]EFC46556.1 predicted protein [Naegleria gruberi]|eukprot:XP_002679300.1 predicted protein [Naegleria gruberi strain NEG-M]